MVRAYLIVLALWGGFGFFGCAGIDRPDRDVKPEPMAQATKAVSYTHLTLPTTPYV